MKQFLESWFYVPELSSEHLNKISPLSDEESHHAIKIFRLSNETEIIASNGQGTAFLGHFHQEGKQGFFRPLKVYKRESKTGWNLLMPVLKNKDSEIPLEAVSQFNIDTIQWYQSDKSEKHIGKWPKLYERWQGKLITSLKQAKKCWLPQQNKPIILSKWLEQNQETLIWMEPKDENMPSQLPKNFWLLNGPEAGFSPAEYELLHAYSSCHILNLGNTRIKACHAPIFGMGKLLAYSEPSSI